MALAWLKRPKSVWSIPGFGMAWMCFLFTPQNCFVLYIEEIYLVLFYHLLSLKLLDALADPCKFDHNFSFNTTFLGKV